MSTYSLNAAAGHNRRLDPNDGHPVLLVMVDGLTPSLADRLDCISVLQMREIQPFLGYSPSCHSTILTGVAPSRHGNWFVWRFCEEAKEPLPSLLGRLPRAGTLPTRLLLRLAANTFISPRPFEWPVPVFITKSTASKLEHSSTSIWKAESIGSAETILGSARQSGIQVQSMGVGDCVAGQEARYISNHPIDESASLFLLSFGEVDHALHKLGGGDSSVRDVALRIDEVVCRKIREASGVFKTEPEIVVVSDHGHTSVEHRIDIRKYLRDRGILLNRIPHIIDTTIIRFRVENAGLKQKLKEVLQNAEFGMVLEDKDYSKYQVPMGEVWGDVIFTLTEPWVFSRTIWGFSWMRSMHGYPPDRVSHPGIVASSVGLPAGALNLTCVRSLVETALSRSSFNSIGP